MDDVLGTLGWIMLILLAIVGLVAGWLASRMAGGRNPPLYMAVGVVAAIVAPFALVAVGLGALVAGGILVTLLAGLVFALVVLAIVRAVGR